MEVFHWAIIRGMFPSSPISQEIDSLTSLQARSLRLLKRIRPTHIGLYGDSTLGYDMPLIWAAKLLGLKSVVLPVTKSVPDFIAQSRIKVGGEFLARGSLLGKVVSFFFPHQVHFYRGEKCFFYHPRTVLALLFSRMLSPRPWIYGGGNSDYVFVTGENEKIFLESNMVTKSRIKVTGQYSHDAIYEQWSKVSRQGLIYMKSMSSIKSKSSSLLHYHSWRSTNCEIGTLMIMK